MCLSRVLMTLWSALLLTDATGTGCVWRDARQPRRFMITTDMYSLTNLGTLKR